MQKNRRNKVLLVRKPTFWVVVFALILCIVFALYILKNPEDMNELLIQKALAEAKKIQSIGDVDIQTLISRDTAYIMQTANSNECEVIFPVKEYDYSIGVFFIRENENSEWSLLPVNAVTVYDPNRWADQTEIEEPLMKDPLIQRIENSVNEREMVGEEDLSALIDNQGLVELLRTYNEQTRTLYDFFYDMATKTLSFAFEDPDFNPKAKPYYPVSTELFEEMVTKVAVYSLYSDCTQRFLDDPLLSSIIAKEAGGSAGRWPYVWHTEYLDYNLEMKTALSEYFDLIEELTKRFSD